MSLAMHTAQWSLAYNDSGITGENGGLSGVEQVNGSLWMNGQQQSQPIAVVHSARGEYLQCMYCGEPRSGKCVLYLLQ